MEDKIKNFEFEIRTHVMYGEGKAAGLGDLLKAESFTNAAVIVDAAMTDNQYVKSALSGITSAKVSVFENPVAEPTYDFLDEFRKKFSGKHFDCVIGIGGGSTLDLAKGMATLLVNEGPAITYRGFPKLAVRPLPVIALPTTAGTGSEVTYNAVFTDSKEKRKMGINSKYNYPLHAVLDPLLTLSCPEKVTVSSGMDAMVHTLESFVSRNATIYSRMFSRQAFALLYGNLLKVLDEPGNVETRGRILLGSHFAGAALMNSGAGPAGAMSYPLGAVYKVPHGIAGAVFINKIVRFNVKHGYTEYEQLYDLLDGADASLSPQEKSAEFSKKIDELCAKLKVPQKLTTFGLTAKDIDFLNEQIFTGLKGAIDQNPVPMQREDMRIILEKMF